MSCKCHCKALNTDCSNVVVRYCELQIRLGFLCNQELIQTQKHVTKLSIMSENWEKTILKIKMTGKVKINSTNSVAETDCQTISMKNMFSF